jgi:CheY-like chemotaxis protein
MKRQNVRVIIASEYPEAQDFLQGVVEGEQGVVTIGKSKDVYETLALARNLKPDAAIIDSYLPYVFGFDTLPLSRIGGLDVAQAISGEIPNTKVILLNNLDTGILLHHNSGSGNGTTYSIVSKGANVLFTPHDLSDKLVQPNALVFANVEVKPERFFSSTKVTSLCDKAIFFGGLGVAVGWLLTITVIFSLAGVPLALAGVVTLFLGLAGKLTSKLWRRLSRKDQVLRHQV